MAKPPVPERVRTIAGHMAKNTWNDATREKLRDEWHLSECSMKTHAAEASRRVSEAWDHETIRAKLIDTLDEAAALAKSEKLHPAQAASALVRVAEVYAKVTAHGSEAPSQRRTHIVIGADAKSAVLDALWGPVEPTPLPVHPDQADRAGWSVMGGTVEPDGKVSGGVWLPPEDDLEEGGARYAPPVPQLPPVGSVVRSVVLDALYGEPDEPN